MTETTQPIEKMKKAYRVLNVPEAASALAIKSNYRKLIKRWHPDKPATSSATQDEAVMMTKVINEAYALIENAPLRYYSGGEAAPRASGKQEQKKAGEARALDVNEVDLSKMFFNEKRIEYAVRIIFGALSGAFTGMALLFDFSRDGTWIVSGIVLGAIAFAAGAVKYGDRFWRAVLGNWWMWK
ncbi:MAG: DnaJ domain-containing protein [Acidobacteria bacterium]|nr:DnaJ domain-containing protein [Acidobacteriota bacterium]MBS1866017.1 DnaJ domain-containing protein [Acidobacteriota bacterium]